jgi:hypothetical protein
MRSRKVASGPSNQVSGAKRMPSRGIAVLTIKLTPWVVQRSREEGVLQVGDGVGLVAEEPDLLNLVARDAQRDLLVTQ